MISDLILTQIMATTITYWNHRDFYSASFIHEDLLYPINTTNIGIIAKHDKLMLLKSGECHSWVRYYVTLLLMLETVARWCSG